MIRFRTMIFGAMIAVGALELPLEGQVTPDAARRQAESFLRRLDAGDFAGAAAMAGPGMKAAGVNEQMLALTWQQLGGAQRMDSLSVQAQVFAQGFQVTDFVVHRGAGKLGLRVSVDSVLRVEGFRVIQVQQAAPYSPPAYVDTAAFEELELTTGAEGWPLGATLTLPKGLAKAPVVVLVHGSGSHDRDEAIGANKPFRDLAWGLASRGVAVLRYEKRTWKHGARIAVDTTFTIDDETIEDALAALAQMRAHPRIDAARVYLLGHSLGGLVGPEIAVRDGRLAGLILLAGSPRRLPQLVIEQLDYLKTLPVNAAPAAQQQIAQMRQTMERLERRELPPSADAGGAPAAYFYDLARRDPAAFVRRVDAPLLVLQGGRDYQVTETDLELWKQALAGRSHATFRLYPDLNHLFAPGAGRATPAEYAGAPTYVDARVIGDIVAFVRGR